MAGGYGGKYLSKRVYVEFKLAYYGVQSSTLAKMPLKIYIYIYIYIYTYTHTHTHTHTQCVSIGNLHCEISLERYESLYPLHLCVK